MTDAIFQVFFMRRDQKFDCFSHLWRHIFKKNYKWLWQSQKMINEWHPIFQASKKAFKWLRLYSTRRMSYFYACKQVMQNCNSLGKLFLQPSAAGSGSHPWDGHLWSLAAVPRKPLAGPRSTHRELPQLQRLPQLKPDQGPAGEPWTVWIHGGRDASISGREQHWGPRQKELYRGSLGVQIIRNPVCSRTQTPRQSWRPAPKGPYDGGRGCRL